jgi:hypothetical protein
LRSNSYPNDNRSDRPPQRAVRRVRSGRPLRESGHLEPLVPHGFERDIEHRKEADYKGHQVVMVSHPDAVASVIENAAGAKQGRSRNADLNVWNAQHSYPEALPLAKDRVLLTLITS